MQYYTRITYNDTGWQHPTIDSGKRESSNSYAKISGFGHEEWLFRSEWQIGGWRYAFVQGVQKGYKKLAAKGGPFDLILFTIQPDKRRRYVAQIQGVECLSYDIASDAVKLYKKNAWYSQMEQEVKMACGNLAGLRRDKPPLDILNIRYRAGRVNFYAQKTYAEQGDPILKIPCYQLVELPAPNVSKTIGTAGERLGSENLPGVQYIDCKVFSTVQRTPEHARMQAKLMNELKDEYPGCRIVREKDFVDISVQTEKELILYEIKSDLEPRSVIREAIGQILEYAYHPSRHHELPVKMVIVGRKALVAQELEYFKTLLDTFGLPLDYRVVEI